MLWEGSKLESGPKPLESFYKHGIVFATFLTGVDDKWQSSVPMRLQLKSKPQPRRRQLYKEIKHKCKYAYFADIAMLL